MCPLGGRRRHFIMESEAGRPRGMESKVAKSEGKISQKNRNVLKKTLYILNPLTKLFFSGETYALWSVLGTANIAKLCKKFARKFAVLFCFFFWDVALQVAIQNSF